MRLVCAGTACDYNEELTVSLKTKLVIQASPRRRVQPQRAQPAIIQPALSACFGLKPLLLISVPLQCNR